jgi:hypothetical protein
MLLTDPPESRTDAAMLLTDPPVSGTDAAILLTDAPVSGMDAAMLLTDPPESGTDAAMLLTDPPESGTDAAMLLTDPPMSGTDRALPYVRHRSSGSPPTHHPGSPKLLDETPMAFCTLTQRSQRPWFAGSCAYGIAPAPSTSWPLNG